MTRKFMDVPDEAYEVIKQKTRFGWRTWYEFRYTGECFKSKFALLLAYRQYMRENLDCDVYYDDVGFLKQHKLENLFKYVKESEVL